VVLRGLGVERFILGNCEPLKSNGKLAGVQPSAGADPILLGVHPEGDLQKQRRRAHPSLPYLLGQSIKERGKP
jgi:hypothetical protein